MSVIQLESRPAWSLKLPTAIRYLKMEHAEDFFATGSMMLTTYARCQAHEDAKRRDASEGQAQYSFLGGRLQTLQTVGGYSYMLCTSMNERGGLMKRFSADNFIRIHDVMAFAEAVSRHVPRFESGRMGACHYSPNRSFSREASHLARIDPFKIMEDLSITAEEMEARLIQKQREWTVAIESEVADEPYFLKDLRFASEAEFRIVWTTPAQVRDPLLISCPEAIRYCSLGISR